MTRIVGTLRLMEVLNQMGMLPERCMNAELSIRRGPGTASVPVLKYEVYLIAEDMAKLAVAFQAVATELDELAEGEKSA